MDKTELSKQYESLLSSPLGKNMVEKLTDMRSRLLAKAEEATSSEQISLLNQAYGVRLAIELLREQPNLAKVLPKAEGGKGK